MHEEECVPMPNDMVGIKFCMFSKDTVGDYLVQPFYEECTRVAFKEPTATTPPEWRFYIDFHECRRSTLGGVLRASLEDHKLDAIPMECCTWLQLYLWVHSIYARSMVFNMFIGEKLAYGCLLSLSEDTGMKVGYFTLANMDKGLQLFLDSSRGQWLTGPDDKGRYIGLATDGPRQWTLEQWHAELTTGIQAIIDDKDTDADVSRALRGLFSCGAFGFDRYELQPL